MTPGELRYYSNYLQWAGSFMVFFSCLPLFKNRKPYIKALLFYSLTSIVFQFGQQISMSFFHNQNLNTIGNGFVFFEALTFSLIFFLVIAHEKLKKVVFTLFILYVIWYIVVFFFFNESIFSLIRAGRDLLVILYSIIFFYNLLRNLPEVDLLKFPMFWINSAALSFFSGTFILSLMLDYLVKVLGDDLTGFWAFRNLFRFGFCLVLAYAGWLDWRILSKRQRAERNP